MSGKDLVEKYGNPRLVWGYYPLSADYNSGGCVGGCGPTPPADPIAVARGEASKMTMEQRGGNNAFHFQQHPGYTQHEVGTGCYNPNCHCPNCQGDCLCSKNGDFMSFSPRDPLQLLSGLVGGSNEGGNDALTWIAMIALAYFAYNMVFKRLLRR